MRENPFRRPESWKRSLIVGDHEMPLTDMEADVLLEALSDFRRRRPRSERTHVASSMLFFFGTGREAREDNPELGAWRRQQRELKPDSADREQLCPVDASDPSTWPNAKEQSP